MDTSGDDALSFAEELEVGEDPNPAMGVGEMLDGNSVELQPHSTSNCVSDAVEPAPVPVKSPVSVSKGRSEKVGRTHEWQEGLYFVEGYVTSIPHRPRVGKCFRSTGSCPEST